MYYGELKEHSEQYQCGHASGVTRAFDNCIHSFQKILEDELERGYRRKWTTNEIVAYIQGLKHDYVEHCETFGMGIDETEKWTE